MTDFESLIPYLISLLFVVVFIILTLSGIVVYFQFQNSTFGRLNKLERADYFKRVKERGRTKVFLPSSELGSSFAFQFRVYRFKNIFMHARTRQLYFL